MPTTSKKSSNLFFSGVLILTLSNILIKVIGLTLDQLHVSEDDPFLKLIEGVNNLGKE